MFYSPVINQISEIRKGSWGQIGVENMPHAEPKASMQATQDINTGVFYHFGGENYSSALFL